MDTPIQSLAQVAAKAKSAAANGVLAANNPYRIGSLARDVWRRAYFQHVSSPVK